MKKILLFLTCIFTYLGIYADNFAVETTDRLRVWAEFPEVINADGSSVFYIKVFQHDDDDLDYTAFNMEFVLPMGFRINQVKEGRREVNDIHLTDRADATHSISCNLKNGNDLRIIATSSENANLYKDDVNGNPLDELFTVGLIAEPTIAAGEYTVSMEGIKFCHKNADARIPAAAPMLYTLKVVNTQTGVEEVEAASIDPDDCYDLQGRKVNPLRAHGMIVISKGRKVLVK